MCLFVCFMPWIAVGTFWSRDQGSSRLSALKTRARVLWHTEATWLKFTGTLNIYHAIYWATPTGEAQFKIPSFIGVRNGIPMGRLLCCTISLASSWSLWDVQLIWRAVIGFNCKWRNTSPLHLSSAVSWSARFFVKVPKKRNFLLSYLKDLSKWWRMAFILLW